MHTTFRSQHVAFSCSQRGGGVYASPCPPCRAPNFPVLERRCWRAFKLPGVSCSRLDCRQHVLQVLSLVISWVLHVNRPRCRCRHRQNTLLRPGPQNCTQTFALHQAIHGACSCNRVQACCGPAAALSVPVTFAWLMCTLHQRQACSLARVRCVAVTQAQHPPVAPEQRSKPWARTYPPPSRPRRPGRPGSSTMFCTSCPPTSTTTGRASLCKKAQRLSTAEWR